MEHWGKRKDGRPYKKKKPLKIIINDTKDKKFLKLMNKSISSTPKHVENRIDSITLSRKKGNEPVGQSIRNNVGNYAIKINYDQKNLKSYPLVYRHETDHIFFDEMNEKNPRKVKQYTKDISGLMPFNEKLQGYFNDYRKALKTKNKKKINEALMLYVEEFHSETHEAWGRINLGLDPFKVNKATKEDLNKALKAYNKLHR